MHIEVIRSLKIKRRVQIPPTETSCVALGKLLTTDDALSRETAVTVLSYLKDLLQG